VVTNPAVARAQVLQAALLHLPAGDTLLVGADLGFFHQFARPAWREPPRDDAVFDPAHNAGLGLVSEAFGERFRVRRGDRLTIPTPSGSRDVTIAGVFSDYGNERGSLIVGRQHFAAWFGDELATSIILVLKRGADAEKVRAGLRDQFPGLAVFTQSYLRGEALRIFRQTFAITYALELIGVVVAVLGLGLTMVSLLWERRGELTTLRALGLRHRELAASAAAEGILTAVSGVIVGLATSVALGWLLIHRVNQQTFGWTLETDWPWGQGVALGGTVIAAAAVTSWVTGRWGAQLPAEQEE
jgi:putative ABC transport system permease protein